MELAAREVKETSVAFQQIQVTSRPFLSVAAAFDSVIASEALSPRE